MGGRIDSNANTLVGGIERFIEQPFFLIGEPSPTLPIMLGKHDIQECVQVANFIGQCIFQILMRPPSRLWQIERIDTFSGARSEANPLTSSLKGLPAKLAFAYLPNLTHSLTLSHGLPPRFRHFIPVCPYPP